MQRRHDIDALRVLAFSLLILYHSARVYVADGDFHIKSHYQSQTLQWLMIVPNRWRMSLLFMLSGIAIGLAGVEYRRLRFAGSRSLRLLLPLLFGMFFVVAFQAYCQGRANGALPPGLWAFLTRYWQVQPWPADSFDGWEFGITWNHLWYLAYLWPYTLLLLACMPLLQRLRTWLAAPVLQPARIWLLLLAPICWLAFVRLLIAPHYPTTHSLLDDWTVHADSLPMFMLGYLLARSDWFWQQVLRLRWITLTIALMAITIELSLRWLGRQPSTAELPRWLLQLPWYETERIARACYSWTALLTIFGWGRVWLNRPLRWLPYCSEAVFSWYVLHQTLIVVIAYGLIPLRLGAWVEPLLLISGTMLGCLLLHEYLIRRVRWLRPLFGLKPMSRAGSPAFAGSSNAH